MTDLVKRLRESFVLLDSGPSFAYTTSIITNEAADRIEELESLRELDSETIAVQDRRIDELELEIAALTKECLELRSWTRSREDEIHARHQRDMDAMKKLCAEFQAENAALKAENARLMEKDRAWVLDQTAITKAATERAEEAEAERDALKRGEFICKECGLRKNADSVGGEF